MDNTPKPPANPKSLHVTIKSPDSTYFDGEAESVSSFNKVGPFDVLGLHENFISIVKEKVVIHKVGGEKQEVPIKVGVMKVFENQVSVFLGIEVTDMSGAAGQTSEKN